MRISDWSSDVCSSDLLRIVPETVDPGVLVDDVLRLVRPEAERRSVLLSVHGSKSALRCFADPQALGQILLNLLTNTVKFTPAGGEVALHIEEKDGGIVFRVVDDGIGIDPAEIPRLLRPFEHAGPGLARSTGGSGLGLPLVDALVRLHGGTLRIDSEIGKGTTATVWISRRSGPG